MDEEPRPVDSTYERADSAVDGGSAHLRRRAKLVTADSARKGKLEASLILKAESIADNGLLES